VIFLWTTIVFTGTLVGLGLLLQVAARYLVDTGPFLVDVNDGSRELSIEGGVTILSALYGEEIFIPSGCGGQATCGQCKVRVLGGDPTKVLPTEKPFLSRLELQQGTRLACQVKVKENLKLKIPDHLLDVQLYKAVVSSTVDVTYDMKELRLRLVEPKEMDYSFGHFVQIEIPDPDEGTIRRAYSISSSVTEKNEIEMNVRLHPARGTIPAGKGSTYLHGLREGDEVFLTGPYGDFELDQDPNVQLVCVGGGAGMAPMKNLVLSILDQIPGKQVWLFFGCRGTQDIFYLDMYKELEKKHPHFRVIYALSELKEDESWDGEIGFVHLSVDKHLDDDLRKQQAFLCGPPPMIDAVTEVLLDKNMRLDRIFYDKF